MTSDPRPQQGEPFGRYQLLRRIAAGGMGEVYLARAPGAAGFDKRVVIKRILPHLAEEPGFLELFLDEARIAAQLNHPNIAQIFDLGEVDGAWYLTMEYVAGQDLRRVMHRAQLAGHTTLPLGLTLRIVSDAAAGLDYAHRARDVHGVPLRIVHRDVSPHNILIGFDGGVKLIDFGVAKAANRLQHTATGLLRGKFPYMSPEQVDGLPLDGRADVFSLGIVLWELLTGTRLFKAENDAATVRLISQAEVKPPSSVNPAVPASLDAVCLKALAKRADDRFADAAAMRLALEECALEQHLPSSAAHLEAFMRTLFPEHADEAPLEPSPHPSGTAMPPTQAARPREEAETRAEVPHKRGADDRPTAVAPAATVSVRTQQLLEELAGRKTNLAVPQTRFVGRRAELDAVARLFERGGRVVTLVGPGGTGKTRLADQFAERRLGAFGRSGGAWWVDLTEAQDLEGILQAASRALNVPLAPGKSEAQWVRQLSDAMAAGGEALFVFDNFEQLTAHAKATVGAFVEAAPQARFLCTSREPLGVADEQVFEVPPMQLPGGKVKPEDAEAVELFVDRARLVRPGYAPSDEELQAICDIVKQLDGLALAIELAAARMAVLSPAQLAQRLPRRFELLKGSSPGAAPRQATLKGAIDWSWRLLQPWEQSALAQLSVFRGGFQLEAAEAVVSVEAWPQAPWVLDVVHTLKSKSLVRTYAPPGHPEQVRFGLLESIREYALEKLRASGDESAAAARHAEYFLPLGLEHASAADGPDGLRALDALQLERDNLFQAFQRAVEAQPVTQDAARRGLQAVIALAPLMLTRGPFSAQLAMFDTALRRAEGADVDPVLLQRALRERGRARQMRGKWAESIADFERALEWARGFGDAAEQGRLLYFIGNAERLLGNKAQAQARLEAALTSIRAAGDRHLEARALGSLSALEQEEGRIPEAVRHYERALAILREVGDRRFEGIVLGNLGALEQDRGNKEQARIRYDEALAIHQEVGNRRSEGVVLANLGSLYRDVGQAEEAKAHYRRAVAIHKEVGDRRFEAIGLAALAGLEHEAGRLAEAELKYEQAHAVLHELGDRTWEAMVRAALGAVLADAGQFDAAERALADADAALAQSGDASSRAVAQVCRAHVELAREALAPDPALMAAALQRIAGAEQLAGDSASVREALRCVRRRHAPAFERH